MNLHLVYDLAFILPESNPFSPAGTYGEDWALLRLVDTAAFQMMTGMDRVFTFTLNKQCSGWPYRLMDFIAYRGE